ncbi:hypothetical protein APHAL10511_008565, partial [Amanita phalloides]
KQGADHIVQLGGRKQCGAWLWFPGETWGDGSQEEWPEDLRFPLKNFAPRSLRQEHAYTMEDIDEYSVHLSIPWQPLKDLPFTKVTTYLGLCWDLEAHTVVLAEGKKEKYLKALDEWLKRRVHT